MSELFYPHGGGAELATFLFARSLSRAGHNVAVVTNKFEGESGVSRNGTLEIYRLPLFREGNNGKYSILLSGGVLFSSFLKKMMKWANVVYIPRFWFSSIFLAKAYKRPVAVHLHDYIPICPLSNLFNVSKNVICTKRNFSCSPECIYAYERAKGVRFQRILQSVFVNSTFGWYFGDVIRLSDVVICVSEAQRSLIVRNHGNLSSICRVIHNLLPDASQIDVPGDDFGFFGGPSYLKGFHVLLKADTLLRLKNRRFNVHATKFSKYNGRYANALRKSGILAYGKLSVEEYRKLYSKIGTVLIPSIWAEPSPYVVVEAAIHGKLIIASCIGGIPEQVSGSNGAFMFDAGDHKQLAEIILYVKDLSKDVKIDLGLKNRDYVIDKFDNEKTIKDFVDLLMHICK